MAKRNRIKIPFVGNINLKSPKTWMLFGGVALAGLAYLAYSGRNTGVQFIDKAADTFENYYEDYVGPIGPGGPMSTKSESSTSCTISRRSNKRYGI